MLFCGWWNSIVRSFLNAGWGRNELFRSNMFVPLLALPPDQRQGWFQRGGPSLSQMLHLCSLSIGIKTRHWCVTKSSSWQWLQFITESRPTSLIPPCKAVPESRTAPQMSFTVFLITFNVSAHCFCKCWFLSVAMSAERQTDRERKRVEERERKREKIDSHKGVPF